MHFKNKKSINFYKIKMINKKKKNSKTPELTNLIETILTLK